MKYTIETTLDLLRAHGIADPVTEHRFDTAGRKWRWDYAWPMNCIAWEIHGKVWNGGRHTRGKGFTGDRAKMNEGQLSGWLVIETTTQQVEDGDAAEWLLRAFNARAKV